MPLGEMEEIWDTELIARVRTGEGRGSEGIDAYGM